MKIRPPRPTGLAPLALAVLALCLFAGLIDAAHAQSPFGAGPKSAPPAATNGVVAWIMAKQSEFYRALSGMIRAAKSDGTAFWGLLGLSFIYGIFHAAGPGHGKAVISSYLIANQETWRRGITLSFASALLQALVAIAIVAVAAVLLGATARAMGDTVRVIETVSYALIILIGLRLIWVKGRAFLAALQNATAPRPSVALAGGGAAVLPGLAAHNHDHGHAHNHHGDHGHVHGAHCGHLHGPQPAELAGPGGWRRGLAAIVAVGLRPCSGAIIVLVFALSQGLFWAGIGATFVMGLGTAITVTAIATMAVMTKDLARRLAAAKPGAGTLALRGIEVGAAALVLAFGILLLVGYMASERLIGV